MNDRLQAKDGLQNEDAARPEQTVKPEQTHEEQPAGADKPEAPRKKDKKRGKSRRKRHILRKLLLMLLALMLLAAAAGYIIIRPEYERYQQVAYEKLASMSRSDFSMRSDTEIFDRDGNRIGLINAGHYEYVPISEISQNIQDAYIAQEDRRFASHNGVDWLATLRAGVKLVLNGGRITQGGSTITQQVIKNTFLTQEQTFSRKIVEILMAPEIEKKYTKADIMEFYCNTNYYGNHCYGVQAASRYYFGKDASELTVPEAATLVGISNSPGRYDPVKYPDACKEKRNRVLASMLKVGVISDTEYNNYTATPLVVVQDTQEGTDENYQSSYALHCAALTLMKLDGFEFQYVFSTKEEYDSYMENYNAVYSDKSSDLRGGGYKIYTSLDSNAQQIVQEELDNVLSVYTELQENGKYALQGAAVVVDNKTGYVVAVVGGRGSDDQLNRAYNAARQPGSCIKPLIDYAPAFDTGEYYPARIVNDHYWEGGPKNAGGGYSGNVTVRYALNKSLNTVAWQILEDIGIETGLSALGKMQFQRLSYVDSSVPSISIGGFTNGVRVVDMAKGYATLADGGIYSDNTCILRIEQEELGNITEGLSEVRTQVYRDDTAWMITDILKGSFTEGTAAGLSLADGMPCAGKTGTTNDSKDTWFCGYTKYYTTAVWMGYDTPKAMPGVYGSTYAGKIWKQAMNRLHEGLSAEDFERPLTVEERTDEATGITDWRSTSDEERAAQSLHEKEQAKELAELEALLESYEQHTIDGYDDIETVENLYTEIMNKTGLLDDSPERTALLERAAQKKEQNDAVINGLGDTLERWKEQKQKEEERIQALKESEAEVHRQEAAKEVNRTEVQNAIDAIYAEKYRSAHLTELVNDAVEKLALVSGYADESDYAEKLGDAITYANALPSEEDWQRMEEASRASEEAQSAAAERTTERYQQDLSSRYTGDGTDGTQAQTQQQPQSPQLSGPGSGPSAGPGVYYSGSAQTQ
ncbi:MAG: transglycosylase domain-containing protein [Eubacteriales bacterium]|nr:transglycosylase domain-containing protein [Eubacteriales bacterium]